MQVPHRAADDGEGEDRVLFGPQVGRLLRVSIDQQRPVLPVQPGRNIDGRGRLADAAFGVDDGEPHNRAPPVRLSMISSSSVIVAWVTPKAYPYT